MKTGGPAGPPYQMNIPAQTCIDGATMAIGWDKAQMETRQEQQAREAFSLALQEVWAAWWWEELMVSVQMAGATVYTAGTAFAADAFCYFPATQKYYQAMAATTGNPPALVDPADATGQSYLTNFQYWAPATLAPRAADFSAATAYVAGNQVRYPVDGLTYQLFNYPASAFYQTFIFACGDPAYNGQIFDGGNPPTVGYFGPANDMVYYDSVNNWWQVATVGRDAPVGIYQSAGGEATPDAVTSWTVIAAGVVDPLAKFTEKDQLINPGPFAPLNGHALLPFNAIIPVPGTVRSVSVADPRGLVNPQPYGFQKVSGGVQVFNLCHGVPWVWYRRATPVITGDDFDPTVAYTAMPASQWTFDS